MVGTSNKTLVAEVRLQRRKLLIDQNQTMKTPFSDRLKGELELHYELLISLLTTKCFTLFIFLSINKYSLSPLNESNK